MEGKGLNEKGYDILTKKNIITVDKLFKALRCKHIIG